MRSFIILIILLNYCIIGCLTNWCIEKKLVPKTRQRWSYMDPTIHHPDSFFNIRRRVFHRFPIVETYNDYVFERVCCHGYYQSGDDCRPLCIPDCPANSTCFKPNLCHCNDGYYGHDDVFNSINCQPYCSEPCPLHSKCSAPNICSCLEGYEKINQSTCAPICTKSCGPNSYCAAPDTCACYNNYKLIDNQCEPICENECPIYAQCIEPNKCRCNENYQMKTTSLYEHYCEPICEPLCVNGICIKPNVCSCFDNYQMNGNGTICEAICKDGCINGKCIAPDMCACDEGYLMGPDNKCQPTCKEPCQMGQCIRPNQCQCLDGYTLKENSSNICEPICDPTCVNGICIAPNFCICDQNFTYANYNNISHVCIPISVSSTTIEAIQTVAEAEIETVTDITESEMNSHDTTKMEFIQTTIIMETEKELFHIDNIKSSTESPLNYEDEEDNSTKIFDNCLQDCQCWEESGGINAVLQTKCIHFCINDHDELCVNVTFCKCNEKQLYCSNPNLQNSYSHDDVDIHRYNFPRIFDCKIFHNLTKPIEKVAEHHQTMPANITKWLWLIGGIVIVLIAASVLLMYWRSHRTNCDYTVQYDQSP